MEIVINIPDKMYTDLREKREVEVSVANINMVFGALSVGTPLPKNHGDLIDVDIAFKEFDKACLSWEGGLLNYVPVVIPATTYKEAKKNEN